MATTSRDIVWTVYDAPARTAKNVVPMNGEFRVMAEALGLGAVRPPESRNSHSAALLRSEREALQNTEAATGFRAGSLKIPPSE